MSPKRAFGLDGGQVESYSYADIAALRQTVVWSWRCVKTGKLWSCLFYRL
jgi:hypothetical protein